MAAMIFVKGDRVRYHGPATGVATMILAGDDAIVVEPNEDYDDDVAVSLDGSHPILVPASELEWLSGKD